MYKVFSAVLRRAGLLPAAAHAGSSPSAADRAAKKNGVKNVHNLPFEEWQALNPGATFKDYYVASVLDALSGKKRHATLGPVTQEGSLERAEEVARALIELGISKSDLVVDYGCGTLRIGKPFIEYLEPSRYVGLDVDRRILDSGLAILPAGLAEQKKPILHVIDDEVVGNIASMRPRWIFSKGVMHHVPPADLSEFLGNISRLAHPETTILLWARLSDTTTKKISKRTWFHSVEDVMAVARGFGLDGEVTEIASNKVIRLQRSRQSESSG